MRQDENAAADVVEFVQDDVVERGRVRGQRLSFGRLEEDIELALPLEEGIEVGGEERAGGVDLTSHIPGRAEP